MFSKATAKFVRQIDPEGSLIYVSRVNDSQKLIPLALVVKRYQNWFWQGPKYRATHFTLNDLLLGDEELRPGVLEAEFLTYKGTFGGKVSGAVSAQSPTVSVDLQGRESSELQSSFGKLKKEEVDVKNLLRSSRNRSVDLQHSLVQQVKKQGGVLAIVKERILTTNSCSVTQTKKDQCIFQGIFGLITMLGSSIKGRGSIKMDSCVSLEIPAATVIAYSILDLEIKSNGHFDICLQPGMNGGIEADSIAEATSFEVLCDAVDGRCNGSQEKDLSPLEQLTSQTRRTLFQKLQETMKDRAALSYLQLALEELCSVESPEPDGPSGGQRESADVSSDQLSHADYSSAAKLNAVHLLVSAAEELPDKTLKLLSESSADFLVALNTLLTQLKTPGRRLPVQDLADLLQDNQHFQRAEQLLSTIYVTLNRNTESVWMEKRDEIGPLLFDLSVHGLSLLCRAEE